MDPENPNPADATATPAASTPPVDNEAPITPEEGQPAVEPEQGAPQTPAEGAPAPQQTRQERRDQERAARGIGGLAPAVTQNQPGFNQPAQGFPNSPQFDVRQYADGEGYLDVERANQSFQQNVVQTADAIATARVSQQLDYRDAVHNFERDTDAVTKYDELNPNSPSYTPEIDEAIAQEFQERAFKVVGYTPNGQPITELDKKVRLADIAKRHVTSARALANKLNANTNAAVDAAADSSAPRPSGARPVEKKLEDMSLAELKARVGYHKS